jgi:hypothetical protein
LYSWKLSAYTLAADSLLRSLVERSTGYHDLKLFRRDVEDQLRMPAPPCDRARHEVILGQKWLDLVRALRGVETDGQRASRGAQTLQAGFVAALYAIW